MVGGPNTITLTLSMRFDGPDPDFGDAEGWSGDLVIDNGGHFDVSLASPAEANNVQGGRFSSYTPIQKTDIVTMINEYFVDGKSTAAQKVFKCVSIA